MSRCEKRSETFGCGSGVATILLTPTMYGFLRRESRLGGHQLVVEQLRRWDARDGREAVSNCQVFRPFWRRHRVGFPELKGISLCLEEKSSLC